MAGVLSSSSGWTNSHGKLALIPNEEGWDEWQFTDQVGKLVKSYTKLPEKKVSILALPIKNLVSFPFWVIYAGESETQKIIALQLKKRGIDISSNKTITSYFQSIHNEGNKTLTLTSILDFSHPFYPPEVADNYELAPRFWLLPPNHVVFYYEHGKINLLLTIKGRLAFFQTFGFSKLSEETKWELSSCLSQLQSQNMLKQIQGVVAWSKFATEEKKIIESILNYPVKTEARPTPTLPKESSHLTPEEVSALREARVAIRRRSLIISVFTSIYFVLLLVASVLFIFRQIEISKKKAALIAESEALGSVRKTVQTWHKYALALEPAHFPLETLYQMTLSMPKEGISISSLDQKENKITIMAVARNVRLAYSYKEALSHSPGLASWSWTMEEPQSMQDNTVQFLITGKLNHE